MNEIFKVGDRVWCCIWGWGTVEGIEEDEPYCVHVEFDCGHATGYTKDGKYNEDLRAKRTLFFKEQQFDESRPEPEYELGAWYWIEHSHGKLPALYIGGSFNHGGAIMTPNRVICKIEEPS